MSIVNSRAEWRSNHAFFPALLGSLMAEHASSQAVPEATPRQRQSLCPLTWIPSTAASCRAPAGRSPAASSPARRLPWHRRRPPKASAAWSLLKFRRPALQALERKRRICVKFFRGGNHPGCDSASVPCSMAKLRRSTGLPAVAGKGAQYFNLQRRPSAIGQLPINFIRTVIIEWIAA